MRYLGQCADNHHVLLIQSWVAESVSSIFPLDVMVGFANQSKCDALFHIIDSDLNSLRKSGDHSVTVDMNN